MLTAGLGFCGGFLACDGSIALKVVKRDVEGVLAPRRVLKACVVTHIALVIVSTLMAFLSYITHSGIQTVHQRWSQQWREVDYQDEEDQTCLPLRR